MIARNKGVLDSACWDCSAGALRSRQYMNKMTIRGKLWRHGSLAGPTGYPQLTHSSLALLRAGSPFCNAHVADSFLICAPRGPFARLHFVSPGQLGSAALRLVFPGQMFHGSVGPATLDEVDRICPSSR